MNQFTQRYRIPVPPQVQNKKTSWWVTCGIIFVVVVCGGGFLLASSLGLLAAVFGEPKGLGVEYSLPGVVQVGEEFTLNVKTTNNGSKEITVTRIQLPNNLLRAAPLLEMTPKGSGTTDFGTNTAYDVTLILAPGQSSTVTYRLKALEAGEYTGDLKVSVGNKTSIDDLRVVVAEGGALQSGATTQIPNPPQDIPNSNVLTDKIPYRGVVEILAMVDTEQGEQAAWWGSGTLVTPDGYILTNAHVVSSTKEFDVKRLVVAMTVAQDQPPEPRYTAEVMQMDQALDVAVIRITSDLDGNPVDSANLNLPYVALGDSDALQLGDSLVIIGYPSIGGETVTLTRGEVSGFTAQPEYGNRAFIKTSATIAGGNSGGLATNEKGEMIGIPTQLGYGGDDQYADCRRLVDTNNDGNVDESDSCIPTGGFINAMRPLKLALPYLEAARAGQVNLTEGLASEEEINPSGSVILQEDFSNPGSGWYVGEDADSVLGYQEGEYLVGVVPANFIVNTWLGKNLEDVVINVDVRPYQPTGMGGYGLVCRYQENGDYYGLEITEDGYSAIWKYQNGEYIFLNYWAASSSIPQGGAATMTAACVGNRLTLAVNNMVVTEAFDSTWSSGDIGLFAETFENPNFVAAFDNYVVRTP